MRFIACILIGFVITGQASATTLEPGDALAISASPAGGVLALDPTTGQRDWLVQYDQVLQSEGVVLQPGFVQVTPRGNLLFAGRSVELVAGAFDFYEYNLGDDSITRSTRFAEAATDPSTPVGFRDPLGPALPSRRVAVQQDGTAFVLKESGDAVFQVDLNSGEQTLYRGQIGGQLPQALDGVYALPSGQVLGSGGGSTWALGASPAEDQVVGGQLDAQAVVAMSGAVIEPAFTSFDPATGQTVSLGGYGEFLPLTVPEVTVDSFVLDGHALLEGESSGRSNAGEQSAPATLVLAGLGEAWVRSPNGQFTQRLDSPTPFFDPQIDNVLVTPGLVTAGDFNGDGAVDTADYTVWRDALGTDHRLAGAGNETGGSRGVVDIDDYHLWRSAIVPPPATPPSATPEPGSAAALLLGVVAHTKHRHRNRSID